jgi:putative FmdB family regulatory protein
MPIYEYQCSKCSYRFEKIHGAAEQDLKISCPKCGDLNSQRVISNFACAGNKTGAESPGPSCGPSPRRFS